jgi:hypothetical protein
VSGTYTASCFFKASEYTQAVIAAYNATDGAKDALFDLFTGTVVTSRNATAQIAKHPNGWYRCSVTASFTTSTTFDFRCRPNTASQSDPRGSYSGDGVSGGFVWGAQLEAGSYPTSYIPTTSSTVTRSADVSSSSTVTRSADVAQITGTNFSSWYNQSNWSLFTQFSTLSAGDPYLAEFQGDASNLFTVNANSSYQFVVATAGANVAVIDAGTIATDGSASRLAVCAQANSYAASLNGGAAVVDTSGAMPAKDMTSVYLFYSSYSATRSLNGRVSRLTYYPTRLSNTQLQALTAS